MNKTAQVVDLAMAQAVTTVCRAAIERGIDGADIRTTLSQMDGSGMRDVLTYSFINRSWMAGEDQERHSIMATLARITKAARVLKDGDLVNAAEATGELLEKYKPATYDDVRAGLDAADKLLEALNYDEPSIPREEQHDETGSTGSVSTQDGSSGQTDDRGPGSLGRGDVGGRGLSRASKEQTEESSTERVQHGRGDHLDLASVRGSGNGTVPRGATRQSSEQWSGDSRQQRILDVASQSTSADPSTGPSDHSMDDRQGGFAAKARVTHALLKKAQDTPYSKGWWNTAALAMEKALVLLEDDTLRAALPEDSHLQLDAGLEELRLLYASLELDPRVNAADIHSEYAGEGELDVVNNTAPETLAHVDEADVLLDGLAKVSKVGQPEPEENVIPSGQTSINSPAPHLRGEEIQGEVSHEIVKADRWGRTISRANGLTQVSIACVVNDEGQVLLGRKPEDDDSDMAGQVVLPGGHVEEGETPEAACAREAAEETGASIIVGKELLVQAKNGNELHFFLATMSPDGIPLPGGAQPENNPYDTAELTEVGFQDPATADLDDLNRRVVEMAHPSAVSLATDMSSIMLGEDVEKAQQATGQNIADALWSGFGKAMEAWGGEPFLEARLSKSVRLGPALEAAGARVGMLIGDTQAEHSLIRKELSRLGIYDRYVPESFIEEVLSLSQSWGGTDQTSGMWDHKAGGDVLITDDSSGGKGTAHLKDRHPDGVEGRALEQSVSRKATPEDPDEDPKPRLYKGTHVDKTTGVGESHQHFGGAERFQDGPGPADVTEIAVDPGVTTDIVKTSHNVVFPIQDGIADGAKGGVMPAKQVTMRQVGNDTSASEHLTKAPGEDGMTQPTHLKGGTPAVTIDEDADSAPRMPDARATDRDQRGADVNPLNLAQGDEDIRALGRMWKSLARQAMSDPEIRLAFIRRSAAGEEYEIEVD